MVAGGDVETDQRRRGAAGGEGGGASRVRATAPPADRAGSCADALDLLTARYGATLPILLSGDVFSLDGAASPRLLAGLMSARDLLANPALFAGFGACPWEALETFMCRVARSPLPFKHVVHHVSEMCGPGMGPDKSALLPRRERARLAGLANILDLVDFLDHQLEQQTSRTGGLRRDL